jgi:hypothetical protein
LSQICTKRRISSLQNKNHPESIKTVHRKMGCFKVPNTNGKQEFWKNLKYICGELNIY